MGRFAAARFPAKPLALNVDKPIIQDVVEQKLANAAANGLYPDGGLV